MSLQARRNAWVLVSAALGVLSSGSARAKEPAAKAEQEKVGRAKGRWEFSTGASFNSYRRGDYPSTILSGALRVGGFVSDHLELEGEGLAENAKWLGGSKTLAESMSANILYQFARSRVTPFVLLGADVTPLLLLGYARHAPLDAVHGGAGIKAFVGRRAALRVEYRYRQFLGREDEAPSDNYLFPTNSHRVFVGISLWTR